MNHVVRLHSWNDEFYNILNKMGAANVCEVVKFMKKLYCFTNLIHEVVANENTERPFRTSILIAKPLKEFIGSQQLIEALTDVSGARDFMICARVPDIFRIAPQIFELFVQKITLHRACPIVLLAMKNK